MRRTAVEKLGINTALLIAQLLNVILLVWLLTRFLYQPVLNMLNERTKRIQDSLRDTDQVKEQLANARRDYDAEIGKHARRQPPSSRRRRSAPSRKRSKL